MKTDPKNCPRCHQAHERCKAHNRQGLPCRRWPLKGQKVCNLHGGKSPQALSAADRRLVEREALKALEAFGVPIVVDYQTALLEELHRTAGAVAWLGAIVADLEQADLVWGVTKTKDGGDDRGTTSEAKPNAWYVMWMEQRKHLVDVARECGRAKIDEQVVKIAQEQGRQLAGFTQRVLTAMFDGLVAALGEEEAARVIVEQVWPQLVGEIVPVEFRAIGTGGGV